MVWYTRAVERTVGLQTDIITGDRVIDGLKHLSGVLKGQIKYHINNTRRSHRIEKTLHYSSIGLICGTMAACLLHLAGLMPHGLTFLCGFLPALGAALGGIINQGEFLRIAKRSRSMVTHLRDLQRATNKYVRELNTPDRSVERQPSIMATFIISQAARLMVNEVLDWRVVFVDRPLLPPS